MNKVYIVIKEYNDLLAKRQPWYTVKIIIIDLELNNLKVDIVSNIKEIPVNFEGKVIKIFGLKDIFFRFNRKHKLVYLMTFPVYGLSKFCNLPIKLIVENWQNLKRIFIVALLPKFLLKKSLMGADEVIVISDRSERYISSIVNVNKYIPFNFNNWGDNKKNFVKNKNKTIGYFGPPFTTRDFDEVMKFFNWTNIVGYKFNKKIISRIERNVLLKNQNKHISIIKDDNKLKLVSGFLEREDLLKELLEIDVLLLPFKIVMSELPVVVLEALELGIPVVTTEDSGISIIAKNQKNLLILDYFNKSKYQDVLKFINSNSFDGFNKLKENIIELNQKTINIICQK